MSSPRALATSCFSAGLVATLLLFFHVPVFEGFSVLQTNAKDSRHLHFAIEWGHLSLTGDRVARDRSVWNAPIFHPAPSASTLSDAHLGISLLYSPIRMLGFDSARALQLLQVLMILLDYVAMWILARRGAGLGPVSAAAAALLFAAAAPRAGKMNHFHLFAQFPAVLSLALVAESVRIKRTIVSPWRWLAIAGLAAWQFWCSIYLGALTLLLLALFLGVLALAERDALARILPPTPEDRTFAAFAVLGAALACLPLLLAYFEQSSRFGGSSYDEVLPFLPRPASWIQPGRGAWLWSDIGDLEISASVGTSSAHRLGWGLISPIVAGFGVWSLRRNPWVRAAVVASVLAVMLVTVWPGETTAWKWVYTLVPGASGIRAVGRIVLVLMIPAALCFGAGIDLVARRAGRSLALLLLVACALEQGRTLPAYPIERHRSVPQRIAAALPADCDAFFYSPRSGSPAVAQIDAMWAALASGIPTINGYAAYPPPHWTALADPRVATAEDQSTLRESLTNWLARASLGADGVCWLRERGSGEASWLEVAPIGLGIDESIPVPADPGASGSPPRP